MTVRTGGVVIYIGRHAEYGDSVIVLNAESPNINVIARSVATKQSISRTICFPDWFVMFAVMTDQMMRPYKSSQAGLTLSIIFIFFAREPPLMAFSLFMASSISSKTS